MRILVVGGGGREHALCWALRRDLPEATLFAAPGNPGTVSLATNLPIATTATDDLVAAAAAQRIDLTIIGPEAPLAAGLADRLRAAGRAVFGPVQAAARLESSKAFAKEVMRRAGVPTAASRTFTDLVPAVVYIDTHSAPLVVKASGLAAGKGVVVCATRGEAARTARAMLAEGAFGEAGREIVVEDFLDFSRLERRSPASDPPPASLSELVATAVDDLTALAPRHRLVTRIAPDVVAFVDRPAVERILTNLVSNAAKYSPAGSQITITVDPVGDTALLAVDDEGSGIPPSEREKVFDAFYRAGHQAVAGTHGAGIGLAVVKEVVDRLRARVSVEDSPSGGARLLVAFRAVSLPVSRSALMTGVPDGH